PRYEAGFQEVDCARAGGAHRTHHPRDRRREGPGRQRPESRALRRPPVADAPGSPFLRGALSARAPGAYSGGAHGVIAMPAASPPRILLCADTEPAVVDVRRLLEQAGHEVHWHAVNGSTPEAVAAFQLVVLQGSAAAPGPLQFCRRLRAGLQDD